MDEKYLEHVKGIINEVGNFIKGFLPFNERASFDYVWRHNVEFLSSSELLSQIRVETEKGEKKLSLTFDLLGSVYSPKVCYKINGKDIYLYSHLETKISFVIGNGENPKSVYLIFYLKVG